MLSINERRKILKKNEKKYTEKQIEDISEFVAILADVWVNHQIKDSQDEENGSNLHQGVNGHSG